jgi:hypothetical protein
MEAMSWGLAALFREMEERRTLLHCEPLLNGMEYIH